MESCSSAALSKYQGLPYPDSLVDGEVVSEGGSLRLASRLSPAVAPDQVGRAWPLRELPEDLIDAWNTSRESWLFEDLDYGQWGLHLLTPEMSAFVTRRERASRPDDIHENDIVVGEFLGDSDLLIMAYGPDGDRVIIAGPINGREGWVIIGSSFCAFLNLFLDAAGEKFWE